VVTLLDWLAGVLGVAVLVAVLSRVVVPDRDTAVGVFLVAIGVAIAWGLAKVGEG